MPKTAVIIGGGVGGLSAAIRLAARGAHVTLLEKNARVGGKLNTWAAPHPNRTANDPENRPFKFDTGPSLLTLPLIFADLFHAAGEDVRNYLSIQRLDPIARFRWDDGTTFELRDEEKERAREVTRIAADDAAGFAQIHRRGELIWNLSAETFLSHAPEQALRGNGFAPLDTLRLLTTPLRIGVFANYAKLIDRHIRSQKLRDVLYHYATYAGSTPFRAPATLAVIPYVEMSFGAWYIPGGMYKLAEALESVARKLGVTIRTECDVKQILVEPSRNRGKLGSVAGVQSAAGETIRADCVIANSDVVYTYHKLIDARFRRRYADATLCKIEPGGSSVIFMLGVDGTYPQLAHHNKFMPEHYTDDLRATFETHSLPAVPYIYVCAASRTDPSVAPDGCETLFVMASAPPLDGTINWKTEGPRYRNQIIDTLQTRWGLADLGRRIVVERMITPCDLESLYNANAGTIYGIGSNTFRSAFCRPPNRDRDISGLYFAGGATHPGGGLPLVALSGKIASDLAAEDLGLSRSGSTSS